MWKRKAENNMAYLINPEDQDLLDSVREFCEKEIKEQCKEYDVARGNL